MEEDAKKANRRKTEAKQKAIALKRLKSRLEVDRRQPPPQPVDLRRTVGIMAHTRTLCSCPMCGNYRKYGKGKGKLTVAECKARLKEKE